jgi:hypothetical protein
MHPAQYLRTRKAADFLQTQFGHGSVRTLAKLRCTGGGPRFHKIGRLVVYTEADLTASATSKISGPLASTSDTKAA